MVETQLVPDGKIKPEDCPKAPQLEPHFFGGSKFSCTRDDKKPCLGDTVIDWTKFSTKRADNHIYSMAINFPTDTILTLSDYGSAYVIFELIIDGVSQGPASLGRVDTSVSCVAGEDCVAKDAPHGYYVIPKGMCFSGVLF